MAFGKSSTSKKETAYSILARIRRSAIAAMKGGDPMTMAEREKMMEVVDGTLEGRVPLPTADRANETFKQINNNRNSDYNKLKIGENEEMLARADRALEITKETAAIRRKPSK